MPGIRSSVSSAPVDVNVLLKTAILYFEQVERNRVHATAGCVLSDAATIAPRQSKVGHPVSNGASRPVAERCKHRRQ